MKTHIGYQSELRVIIILCQLSILQIQLKVFAPGLRDLLTSNTWKKASASQKLALLDQQYKDDFSKADLKQRKMMTHVRMRIDQIVTAHLTDSPFGSPFGRFVMSDTADLNT